MDIKEKIEGLRAELHRHNYNYYVLNAPEISDKEFDEKIRELQDLEQAHPEYPTRSLTIRYVNFRTWSRLTRNIKMKIRLQCV